MNIPGLELKVPTKALDFLKSSIEANNFIKSLLFSSLVFSQSHHDSILFLIYLPMYKIYIPCNLFLNLQLPYNHLSKQKHLLLQTLTSVH